MNTGISPRKTLDSALSNNSSSENSNLKPDSTNPNYAQSANQELNNEQTTFLQHDFYHHNSPVHIDNFNSNNNHHQYLANYRVSHNILPPFQQQFQLNPDPSHFANHSIYDYNDTYPPQHHQQFYHQQSHMPPMENSNLHHHSPTDTSQIQQENLMLPINPLPNSKKSSLKKKSKIKGVVKSESGAENSEEAEGGELGSIPCTFSGCSKKFKKSCHMKSHLKIHNTERSFTCDICSTAFRRSHDLKRHIQSLHDVIKKWGCVTCGKRFARTDALKRHINRAGVACFNSKTDVIDITNQPLTPQHHSQMLKEE
ncbi:hypothetical protein HDU92_003823 [Lobulomyces angularis]|nr:hypothetical protein HDU92_003823 [Lobulomyces angularis]